MSDSGNPYWRERPPRPPEAWESPSLTEALANLGKRRGKPTEHDRPRRRTVPPHLRPTHGQLDIYGRFYFGSGKEFDE